MSIKAWFLNRHSSGVAARRLTVATGATDVAAANSPTVSSGTVAASASENAGSLWLNTGGPPEYRQGGGWRKIPRSWYCNVATGASLTASTTETVLLSTTIPAGLLVAATVVRIRALIKVSADAGATTLTGRLRIGATTLTGTVLLATTATDTAANSIGLFNYDLVVLADPGATAAVRGMGFYSEPGAVAAGGFKTAALGTGGGGATLPTNGALLIELTGQWSASDANACQGEILSVEVL